MYPKENWMDYLVYQWSFKIFVFFPYSLLGGVYGLSNVTWPQETWKNCPWYLQLSYWFSNWFCGGFLRIQKGKIFHPHLISTSSFLHSCYLFWKGFFWTWHPQVVRLRPKIGPVWRLQIRLDAYQTVTWGTAFFESAIYRYLLCYTLLVNVPVPKCTQWYTRKSAITHNYKNISM